MNESTFTFIHFFHQINQKDFPAFQSFIYFI